MAKDSALLAEVHRLIGQRMDAEEIVQPSAIVDLIFENRPLLGEHASFYRVFARKELVKMVSRVMRNVGVSDDPAPMQMVFQGHKRLVKSYPVLRNGQRALVPIGLCSRQELRDHITLLRKQATGCESHAVELESYVAARDEDEAEGTTQLVLERE
jgi:hypothetical protein